MWNLFSNVNNFLSGSQSTLLGKYKGIDSKTDVNIPMETGIFAEEEKKHEQNRHFSNCTTTVVTKNSSANRQQQEYLTVPSQNNDEKYTKSRSYDPYETHDTQMNAIEEIKRCKSSHMQPNAEKRPLSIFSIAENHIGRLNTQLLDAIEQHNNVEVQRLLEIGANCNASCHAAGHVSACHAAAYANSSALSLLLRYNAEMNRNDKFGRTPMHFAAWAGRVRNVAILLGFPEELKYKLSRGMTPEVENEIKELRYFFKSQIDVSCELPLISVLPKSWKDSIEHKCRKYMAHLPKFFSRWTPLHITSYAAHPDATRLLLAAGANPNSKDAIGRTPLDIVGGAYCLESYTIDKYKYLETIKILIECGGQLNTEETKRSDSDSALHIAVGMSNAEAVKALLAAGAPVTQRNVRGNTPLHECVSNFEIEPLQVMANHTWLGQTYPSVDVRDASGYTVLHRAILASWVTGVCLALDAGADVTLEAYNGFTAIHLAARKGNLDILNEILNSAQSKNVSIKESRDVETILFCAVRSGSLDCVQRIIHIGALSKLLTYTEPDGITITEPYHHRVSKQELEKLDMIVHATAEVGYVDILEFLLNQHGFENLLDYRCPYLRNTTPVEFAAFHNRFESFKFLLSRTFNRLQARKQKFDPSVLLDIVALSNQEEMLCEILKLIPDAVYIATENGHYPLHSAIKFGRGSIILQLIKNGADLAQRDEMGNTPIDLFMEHRSKPTEFIANMFDGYIQTNDFPILNRNCEITVDYSVLIPRNDKGQMGVLKAILKTGNNEDQRKLLAHPLVESFLYLKWKTFSTYFYMMVFFYTVFVMSLSIYIVSVFYYKDMYNNQKQKSDQHITYNKDHSIPKIWNPIAWQYIILFNLSVIVIQELSCINLSFKKWITIMLTIEFWIKSGTFVLAIVMPLHVRIESSETEWRRHLATLTLVLAWSIIMLLLSKTPISGYYMQMFWKVSTKIIKILITFLFLILMFSFGFMVQFHTQEPFDGPWAALVKTLVMMTSEFDYSGTFTKEKIKYVSTSIQILRIVFVVFMILAAIVLMNLMIGVAVHDVQYLVQDGNLRRLENQVSFLNSLELSRGKTSIFHILGMHRLFNWKKVQQKVKIKLVKDDEYFYTRHLKEALMNKAQEQLDRLNKQAESIKCESKLDEILQAVTALRDQNLMSHINELNTIVRDMQRSQHLQTVHSSP